MEIPPEIIGVVGTVAGSALGWVGGAITVARRLEIKLKLLEQRLDLTNSHIEALIERLERRIDGYK